MEIRPEDEGHVEGIRAVHRAAFGGEAEAGLVDALRAGGHVRLSLVAEDAGRVVGHILFSELNIDATPGLALAPMGVLPSHQRRGVGSALIRDALARVRELGHRIVVVLGHREYYPRFGFRAELAAPFESPYAGEHFMALELQPGALQGVRGRVAYAPPFDALA